MVGDVLTATGNIEYQGTSQQFLSAHTVSIATLIATATGDPDYVVVAEAEMDVDSFANLRMKSLNIGMMSSNSSMSLYRVVSNGSDDALGGAACERLEFIGGTNSCLAIDQTCTANAAFQPFDGSGQVVKIVYDWDFGGGAKDKLNPALNVSLSGDPDNLLVAGDSDANNSFRVFSPVARDIVYKTGTREVCEAIGNCATAHDANGKEAQWGFYLSPLGIGFPEWDEIDLSAGDTPFNFGGIPWNHDRRLGPDGGGEAMSAQPLGAFGLDPFPSYGHAACAVIADVLADGTPGGGGQQINIPSICTEEWLVRDSCVLNAPAPPPSDFDNDGVPDEIDNCIEVANGASGPGGSQRDTDGDGFGNMCDADLSNDSLVSFGDLVIFQLAWATAEGDADFEINADFDGNGSVGFSDFSIFLNSWLLPPGPSGTQ